MPLLKYNLTADGPFPDQMVHAFAPMINESMIRFTESFLPYCLSTGIAAIETKSLYPSSKKDQKHGIHHQGTDAYPLMIRMNKYRSHFRDTPIGTTGQVHDQLTCRSVFDGCDDLCAPFRQEEKALLPLPLEEGLFISDFFFHIVHQVCDAFFTIGVLDDQTEEPVKGRTIRWLRCPDDDTALSAHSKS